MSLTDEDKAWLTATTEKIVERTETKLLTAFHQWASPTDQKTRVHREAIRAPDLQIEEIGARVQRLENAS